MTPSRSKASVATWRLGDVAEAQLDWLRHQLPTGSVLATRTQVVERAIDALYQAETLRHDLQAAS